MGPITDVREVSRIAYGFKASKALFVAIELDLFSKLSKSSKSLSTLVEETGIAENRLETLLTALNSLGLLANDGRSYCNAPASEDYLVKGKPAYFGDYFMLQTDKIIFPAFNDLGPLIRGEVIPNTWRDYETLMRDRETAERFSKGQHAGSMGPAILLSKQVDLSGKTALLDVAGGSGAFTIMLCKRNPNVSATILDFPTVLPIARHFVAEAAIKNRVEFVGCNVITEKWPHGHDVILMSYLFSAVSHDALPVLLEKAHRALPSGGTLIVHDFMVENDKTGPRDAALWFLTCMFNCPEAVVLTPGLVWTLVEEAGFKNVEARDLIPGLTKAIVASKP
jgi:2-hydroxy-4-(methylsulfanyl)butanoate S-methyltransferase